MEERHKEILITSVIYDAYMEFQNKYIQCKLIIEDKSLYDYELLKAALHRKEPKPDIVNFLLKRGCKVINPRKISSEETLLHLAMKLNDNSVIKRMLKLGASIYDKNHEGETPLYTAFKKGYYNSVDAVLNYYSSKKYQLANGSFISLNPTNKDDILHFHIACIRNNVNAVKLYLKYRFDVNSPFCFDTEKCSYSKLGFNPLHHAIFCHHFKLIQCLLEYGADVSIKNSRGESSLHMSISYFPSIISFINTIRQVFRYGNTTKFINSLNSDGISHFHLCCTLNCPDLVKVFIDNGVDVNISVESSNCMLFARATPLEIAVESYCDKVVQLLLENGADCNKVIRKGITLLHVACNLYSTRAARSIIKMLLCYKANVTAVDKNDRTPLHIAFDNFDHDDTVIYDMLLSKLPREVNFTDNEGLSHFHIICTRNDISRVEDFLKAGVAVNSQVVSGKYGGYTALHFAVLHNQKDVLEVLLKWNAQVKFKTNILQFTPLHTACNYFDMKFHRMKSENLELKLKLKSQLVVIELLLLHGADVDSQDCFGRTPLLYICTHDSMCCFNTVNEGKYYMYYSTILKEILQILLLNKANVNAQTNTQKSILHIISECFYLRKSKELVEFLIDNGADVHAVDGDGLTPLHLAVKSENEIFVEIFLKHKADVNAKSKEFKIPLNYLFILFIGPENSSLKNILLLLLENGSDVNTRYENGKTLWLEEIKHHKKFARIPLRGFLEYQIYGLEKLLNYGADINMEDSLGDPLIVSTLNEWQIETDNRINELNANTFSIIYSYVKKLLAAGLYVNEKVQKCCHKLWHRYNIELEIWNRNLDNIYDNCIQELNRMKLVKVDDYTSLYSIASNSIHEFSKYVRNSALVNILEDENIHDNFPFYGYLLKMRFKKSLIRNDVLKSANVSLASVIGFNLPDLCCDSILKYLANEEIVNLKAAALGIKENKQE